MANSGKTQPKLADLDYSLGGFDWVDRDSTLWPSFAKWLIENWHRLYKPAFGKLFAAMEKAIAKLADELPKHSSLEQLALVHTEARKLGLTTTREQVEDELERFLTFQPLPQYDALLKASPWRNYFPVQEHIFDQINSLIPVELYPPDSTPSENTPYNRRMAGCRMALETVARHFYCRIEPVQEIEGEKEVARFALPQRLYQARCMAFNAAQNLSKFDNAQRGLADFIIAFMHRKNWPRQPAGLPFDPTTHFDPETCRAFVRQHLGLATNATIDYGPSEAWHFLSVSLAVIYDDELQIALLRLADDADARKKGYKHFRNALTELFARISAAFEPAVKTRVERLVLLADNEIRAMRAKGQRERDIVQLIAKRLNLPYSSATMDKGGTLDTYFREACKKHGFTDGNAG